MNREGSSEGHDGLVIISDGPPRAPWCQSCREEVGAVVDRAHEEGIDVAAAAGHLSQDQLESVLTYCAEQRCVGDGATCAGCRLRREAEGIRSLDDFVAQHGTISLGVSGTSIRGGGGPDVAVASLEWLTRHWAGEEYWFWARRALRKLRYGLRTTDELFEAGSGPEASPAVILVEPQIPENIGMAARAMANFGVASLRVVAPRDGWPNEKARAVASGAAAVIDDAMVTGSLCCL